MHPDCPDYDLCQNCEALPIAVHPANHPMLKMKTPDTVIPTVYRVGERKPAYAFGSITPTPGPRADGRIRGTRSPDTFASVTRAATPTPASMETAVPMKEVNGSLSSTNSQGHSSIAPSPPKATSMDPFADIFSVKPSTLLPPPLSPAVPNADNTFIHAIPMVNPWPAANDAGSESNRQFLLCGLVTSGNTSPRRSSASQVDEPEEDHQIESPQGKVLLERLFGSEKPSDPSMAESADNAPDSKRQPSENLVSASNDSQQDGRKPSVELFTVRESLASLIRELPTLVPPPVSPSAQSKISNPRISLSAAFVEDVTVPDGQVFPPGAEFVKCWRLMNDSGCEWPESTELIFIAGDLLSAAVPARDEISVPVGKTGPGETIEVWTGELKAPDVPGRYVGYWRLRANGELFGNSLWVE